MDNYQKLAHWLKEQTENIPYGEIAVRIICHDNQIRYIEKTTSIKERPKNGNDK